MISISPATLKRLRKIKQTPGTWEGARCALPVGRKQRFANVIPINEAISDQPQYIFWADASAGAVRSMEVVQPGSGSEALVRSLLQAIERPQSNLPPLRPQKIIVNDRESQFYLRGILQELDITVEFAERLPLIEEILYSLGENLETTPDPIPPELAPALYTQAMGLWKLSPWEDLSDHEVIEIKIDRWDTTSLFAIFMGKLGLELGVIFYRTLESLKKFRYNAVQDDEDKNLEETFLSQDCIFMLFNRANELNDTERQIIHEYGWKLTTHYPCFGILHPLEGDRSFLYEGDALTITAALEGLQLFLKEHKKTLRKQDYPALSSTYSLTSVPENPSVTLSTLVEVSQELLDIGEEFDEDDDEGTICTYIIPDNTLVRLTTLAWKSVNTLQEIVPNKVMGDKNIPQKGEGMPVLMFQNSKNNITRFIDEIEGEGGFEGVCFSPAEDMFGQPCQLGLLVTGNEKLHLFSEFFSEEDQECNSWKQRCQQTQNKCVILLAMGIRGETRGNPKPNHILAYYEVDLLSPTSLGLGMLRATTLTESDF